MLENESVSRRGRRWPVVLGVAASIAVGAGMGFFARQPAMGNLQGAVAQRDRDLAGFQERLAVQEKESQSVSDRLNELSRKAEDLQRQVAANRDQAAALASARAQAADLQTRLDAAVQQAREGKQKALEGVRPVSESLASDRLLLIELRKDAPDNRQDAERYWANVREIALQSSAVLRPQADRVRNALPAYFNWRERRFASAEEQGLTYILTGAAAYETSVNEFWNAVLLQAIDHIDALTRLASS